MLQFPFARHCSVRLYLGWLIHIWCSPGSSGGKYKSDNWGIFGQSQAYQGGLVRLLDTESIFLSFLWQTLGNVVIVVMMMFRQLDIDDPRVLTLTIISFHLHHNSPPISQLWPQLMSHECDPCHAPHYTNTGLSLVRAQWPEACDWSGHQHLRIPPGFRGVRASRSCTVYRQWRQWRLLCSDHYPHCSTLCLTFQPDAGGLVPNEAPCQGNLILQKSVCN